MRNPWTVVEKAANVVVILAGLLVCATVILNRSAPASGAPGHTGPKKGDQLADVAGLNYGGAANALVMVISSACHFCTESMPFYRRIASLPSVKEGTLSLAVISGDEPQIARDYIAQHGLEVSQLLPLAGDFRRVPSTPTLLLLNRKGVIEQVWVGKLSADAEEEVIRGLQPGVPQVTQRR